MKRKVQKWLKRFDGMMAWRGSAFDQWERSKQRKQQARKRKQAAQQRAA